MRVRRRIGFPIPLMQRLEGRLLLSVATQPAGPLAGKIVYTSGGHGFTSNNLGNGKFRTQRGEHFELVEDLGNQDQMSFYVDALWRSGATVVPMRPIGRQSNEVIVDNADPGFSVISGSWGNGSSTPYFSTNGGNGIRYRSATGNASETAVVRFTPNIPQPGFYPVYAWALDGANRLPDQLYRVHHTGGATEVKVNHQRVGKGWVYLGAYYFSAGTTGYIEVSNKTSSSGTAIADAIRFGNGMGDVNRGGGVSGLPREDESSLYWIERSAGYTAPGMLISDANWRASPPGVYDDDSANVSAPARWATYMNREQSGTNADRIYLGFHSNAGSGSNQGTLGLYNSAANATPRQFEWANLVGREVNDDLVALAAQLEHPWFHRNTVTLDRSDIDFGEISNDYINDEFAATIIEIGFHDNQQDAEDMRDPDVRFFAARASAQATVRYFNQYASAPLAFAPEAAINVRAISDQSGNVTVRWNPRPVDGIGGQAPTGYFVQRSSDGYGFDAGVLVGAAATSHTFTNLGTNVTWFRVVATNSGGASPASEVVAARSQPNQPSPVLIVNGFDRIDRAGNDRQSAPLSGTTTLSTFDRVRLRYQNTKDYVVQTAQAIAASNGALGFDSAQNESITNGQIDLSGYHTVIWLAGEESSADDTFNPAERSAITAFLNAGGNLFVSGAEIGFELVELGADPAFYADTLKTAYVSDDANSRSVTGAPGSIFAGLSFSFDNGASGTYDVDFPDVLGSAHGSLVALNYATGGAAGITYASPGSRIVNLGFPFESITNANRRRDVMDAVLEFFGHASISGISAAEQYYLRANDAATHVQIFTAGPPGPGQPPAFEYPVDLLSTLTLSPGAGADSIHIDSTNANPLPPRGLYVLDSATAAVEMSVGGRDAWIAGITELTIAPGPGGQSLDVRSGTLSLTALGDRVLSLTIRNDASATLLNSASLAALEISGNSTLRLSPGASKLLRTSALSLAPGATLDLHDNDLLVEITDTPARHTLFNALHQRIASARNANPAALWAGPGLTSTAARNDATGHTTLAIVETPAGVSVKCTWTGDADADGRLNSDDYKRIDQGFLRRQNIYPLGNFNYDNIIDLEDYALLDEVFLTHLSQP